MMWFFNCEFILGQKKFHLHSTEVLEECVRSCWKEDVYLQPLCPKFWRLSLQMFSRYATWIHDLYQEEVRSCDLRKKGVGIINKHCSQ